MDHLSRKAHRQLDANSSAKGSSKRSARKARMKKQRTRAQVESFGQPAGAATAESAPSASKRARPWDGAGATKGGIPQRGCGARCWNAFLSLLGRACCLVSRKRTDDMILLDDESIESSLLRPEGGGGGGPTPSEDFLSFVPEHEGVLADFAESVALPKLPKETMDY